jgi:putative transcriptional regulator
MPTYIDLEPALLRWQGKHGKRLTYEELAKEAGISIAALYRIKSGKQIAPDLRKINQICKVLECEPGDLIRREQTREATEMTRIEMERQHVLEEINRKSQAP